MKRTIFRHHQQSGSVLIMVAFAAVALFGFMGIVIDLGRLFVTKTELQSVMDSCSLAAAAELRPGVVPPDTQAITRAVNAGLLVGNRNSVGFQEQAASITAADILFSDHLSNNTSAFPYGYVSSGAADPATAKFAMCAHAQSGISTWFIQVLEDFLGAPSGPKTVGAWAAATLKSSQINCAIPIGLCKLPAAPVSNPFQGLVVGQWMTSKLSASATGSFDWVDFTPPGGGANELADLLKGQGQCSLPSTGTQVGEQGNKNSLGKGWNTRFGIYKGSDSPATAPPDYTGYAYTPTSWPSKFNAFGGSSGTTPNFQTARASHLPFQGAASGISLSNGNNISNSAVLQANGTDRRLVTVPILDCTSWAASNPQQVPVLGYACVLMLHPMSKDNGPSGADEVWLEYRSASNDPASPCATSGLGGGAAGPLVPVLVH